MITRINSVGLLGLEGFLVSVEADISQGLPSFDIVGLPDASVKESKERVRSALKNSDLPYPIKKITLNLAPGNVKKEGPIYDLPILMALLCATGVIPENSVSDCGFLGEVALDGSLRAITGALPMTVCALENGIKKLFVPADNAPECSVIEGICVYPLAHIKEAVAHFNEEIQIKPAVFFMPEQNHFSYCGDFNEVKGQSNVKRALEIAAAGFHNVLMIGPPGSGKSMLAKRLPSILPPLTMTESIESTKIHSIVGLITKEQPLITTRPFRAPHHTVSAVGLSGGTGKQRPGEISLAHNGVLFLDELPEFSKAALEVLRQPIEDGVVTITRAAGTVTYPSRFMLVCASNPCRCGYFSHPTKKCTCTPAEVSSYMHRISGPLLDRIDMHIDVAPVLFNELSSTAKEESSAEILKRVINARKIQEERYGQYGILTNSQLDGKLIEQFCPLGQGEKAILASVFDKLGLSARAYNRIIKVSRTIADLDGAQNIQKSHIMEAIQYRSLDRKYFQ